VLLTDKEMKVLNESTENPEVGTRKVRRSKKSGSLFCLLPPGPWLLASEFSKKEEVLAMQFTDPRSEYGFIRIFGDDHAHDILISFLNAVMGLEGERRIKSVVILNPGEAPRIRELKYSFLDVKCTDYRDIHYVVEITIEYVKGLIKRILYDPSKAYVRQQIERGEDYPKLNQVISINILDFTMFENPAIGYLSHYLALAKKSASNQCFLKEICYYFIELPKFTKTEHELTNDLERWVFFLKNAGSLDYIPQSLQVEVFKKAFDIANRSNLSRAEWELYDQSMVSIQDRRGVLEAALEKGLTEGKQIGLAEGKQIGLTEGKQIGLTEGKQIGLTEGKQIGLTEGKQIGLTEGKQIGLTEGKQIGLTEGKQIGLAEGKRTGMAEGERKGRLEAARKLLKAGVDPKIIRDTTGISEEELGNEQMK
jgi:predicted transposase/invertase (TIGR01784 family)